MNIKAWIGAARLRTLPLALSTVGMGAFLAEYYDFFNGLIFALTVLTTILLQILSNLANDYGDSVNGADHQGRTGPMRAVQSGAISQAGMKKGVILFSILSLISGLGLLWVAFSDEIQYFLIFLGLGILAIVAAIAYTAGRNPYGYAGFGDLFVFLFFGLVGVAGSFFLYGRELPAGIWLPAISCGLFSVDVLNINNIRDIESDKAAGKRSIPVRIGKKAAVFYHTMLIILGLLAAGLHSVLHFVEPLQWVFVLSAPMFLRNVRAVKEEVHLDPWLRQLALTTLIFVVLFGLGLVVW